MYLNNVTSTGFIGGDAEIRTTKSNINFTVFSPATKNSWKDRETGEWNSRTEWHQAVVFGRLTTFSATLKKGDHVQIRANCEPANMRRLPKARSRLPRHSASPRFINSILKLGRSWKQNGVQTEAQEVA